MTRVTAVLLASFVVAAACEPRYCTEEEIAHCDGNVLVTACDAPVNDGSRRDCGSQICAQGFDVNGSAFAVCATDGHRDARCRDLADGAFCDGTRAVTCKYGFPVGSQDCGLASLLCATDGVSTACVDSLGPDARCPETSAFCQNDVLEGCFGQLRTPMSDCMMHGSFCHDASGGDAACVLDASPDPRCTNARHFCDGTKGFSCFDGFRQSLEGDCALQGKTCVDEPDFYGCR